MNGYALTGVLLLFGTLPMAVPQPEPWTTTEAVGYIETQEELVLFGVGNKRLWLKNVNGGYLNLMFGCQSDYAKAERNIGQLVEIKGVVVTRGTDSYVVPRELAVRKP